ncbi:MAG: glutamate 5-kinase [Candidatus Omnitrophica bacterium]|nr:glutamate 5-kinase [Candidatus Omnitrophota bacterium]
MTQRHALRAQRVVVKVGASVLTDAKGRLLPQRMAQLVEEIAAAHRARRQLIVVSSGAIACGMAQLGIAPRPTALAQLQACAAVGQGELMHRYTTLFAEHGVLTAQVLLTQDDLSQDARLRNTKQTLLTLLHRRVVPIVNENDTVSVEEITFGDNDRLAAYVACAVEAQLLVILSDVDGFLKDGKPLARVQSVTRLYSSVKPGTRHTTKGGMASKLDAARIVGRRGISMILANGTMAGVVTHAVSGRQVGTRFAP